MATVGARLRTRMAGGPRPSSSSSSAPAAQANNGPSKQLPKRPPKPTPVPLSEEDLRDLRTAFVVLDSNQDGRLTAEDLSASLAMLGYSLPDDQALQQFVKKVSNGGESIREQEFVTWVEVAANTSRSAVLLNAFNALDRDQDGYVTKEDLSVGLSLLHEHLSPAMLALMFNEADTDEDGRIDYKDFLRAMGERQ